MKWDLDDLVSTADIAIMTGFGMSTVSNWIARYPDFPKVLATVGNGRTKLFSRYQVFRWYEGKAWMNDGPGSASK